VTLSERAVSENMERSDLSLQESQSTSDASIPYFQKLYRLTTFLDGSKGVCFEKHRIVEVGRDLWRSPIPTPLLKQSHLEQAAHDHVQMAFEYLQGWRLHSFSR